jgi:amidase
MRHVPAVTRRKFLETTVAAGAASLAGSAAGLFAGRSTFAAPLAAEPWLEATIPQLHSLMGSGALTSRELTQGYLQRIAALNPVLRAVIETNPNALQVANQRDAERKQNRGLRGPLHGIPVLIKDNIGTADNMLTTAGSLALVGARNPGDARLIARVREAGAVILGKANLGEWANFRGFSPFGEYGWTARGGETQNPYVLDYSPFGSSSGSGAAVAANLCAVAIGTETDGSITSPANATLTCGLKPTLGLVSQNGIVPICQEQDTAGPMTRTITDLAVLLGVMRTPFGAVAGEPLPVNYTQFLQRGALNGKRIGVDTRFFDYSYFGFPGDEDSVPLVEHALDVMQSLGATIVPTDTGDIFNVVADEFFCLICEFKDDIAAYLATRSKTDMQTLSDLIAFNLSRCSQELVTFGQEIFELADSTLGRAEPGYAAARANIRALAKAGIDNAIASGHLDAIVAPHLTNTTGPAVAGYPNLALPVGQRSDGRPAGLLMYGVFLSEPTLIACAYDLEQEMHVRTQPEFLGSPRVFDNAGLCQALPAPHTFKGKKELPHGKLFVPKGKGKR